MEGFINKAKKNKRVLIQLIALIVLSLFLILAILTILFLTNEEPESDDDILHFNYSINHLGSLEYNSADLFGTEYRCTAILMSPNHMLTTTNCDGSQIPFERPSHVLLASQSANTGIKLGIRSGTEIFAGELVLNSLSRSISDMEFATSVSVAPRCKDVNLNKETKLLTIGFGQNNDGKYCGLFRQMVHLISSDKCKSLDKNLNSKDHVCVKPGESYPSADKAGDCKQCLTASASVLHVHRTDGSLCVVGLATPTNTTKECIVNREPVYYTLLDNILGAREFH